MKIEKASEPSAIMLSTLTGRLEAEATREDAEEKRIAAAYDGEINGMDKQTRSREARLDTERLALKVGESEASKAFQFDRPCITCHGDGFLEHSEQAKVPSYKVVQRYGTEGKNTELVNHVAPPTATIRACCPRCAGRGRNLAAAGRILIENLVSILRDEIKSEVASVAAFNLTARAELAIAAKRHEVERARHEAADQLEREAAEKAAAIRSGATQPEARS